MRHKKLTRSFALLLALLMMVGLMTPALAVPDTSGCTVNSDGQHTWDGGSITTEATCGTPGVRTYTCSACSEQRTEEIPATGAHSYGDAWSADPSQHWHECSVCHDKTDAAAHSTAAGWSNNESTHWHVCDTCQQMYDSASHTAAAWDTSETEHWHTCSVCGYQYDKAAHSYSDVWKTDGVSHWKECACGYSSEKAAHDFTGSDPNVCKVCGYRKTVSYTVTLNANGGSVNPATVQTDSTGKLGTLPTPARSGYTFKGWFTAPSGGTQVVSGQTISGNMTLYAQWTGGTYTVTFSVPSGVTAPPAQQVTAGGRPTAVGVPGTPSGWTFKGWTLVSTSTFTYTGQATVDPSTQTINANTVFYAVYTRTASANLSATLRSAVGVAFSDNNTTINGTSILTLLTNQMSASLSSTLAYVRFGGQSGTACGNLYTNSRLTGLSTTTNYYNSAGSASTYPLGSVYFLPTGTAGTWSITYSAYDNYGNSLTGVLSLTVPGESAGKVTYTTSPGTPVTFNAEDFNNLLQTVYKNRTLSWVQFTTADSFDNNRGYIYYNYGGSGQTYFTNATLRNYKFYYNDSRQGNYPLSSLSFVPGSLQQDYSISLNFNAYYSSSVYVSGTLELTVTAAAGVTDCDITYTTTQGRPVPIRVSDLSAFFQDNYSSYDLDYIVLRGVPSTGTLYYNYNGSSNYGSNRAIQLTAGIAANYKFYAEPESSRDYALSALTYVPSGSNYCVTIPFTAYSSSGSRNVKGAILINVTDSAVSEVYSVSTGGPVKLNADAIYSAVYNATGQKLSYIQFTDLPNTNRGTLYYNYSSTGTGRKVTSDQTFRYTGTASSMNDLAFVPRGAGSVNLAYIAFNSSGRAVACGNVAIGTVSRIITYSDVASGNWYYKYVTELSDAGVINGMPDGSYAGNRNVTYGEALKLILLATGYPEQPKQAGKHWAAGYLEMAQTYGFLSAGQINLDSPISRQAVASLAANAMRLRSYPSMSPFADTSDPSVLKLYEAGIVEGSYGSNGAMYYYPSNTITRAEVATIVWRIYNASR